MRATILFKCLSSCLESTALIASLLCQEGKQAIISRQEEKQSIEFKAGEIKCPPNEWRNIPLHDAKQVRLNRIWTYLHSITKGLLLVSNEHMELCLYMSPDSHMKVNNHFDL